METLLFDESMRLPSEALYEADFMLPFALRTPVVLRCMI
jgi:hypothetical protein